MKNGITLLAVAAALAAAGCAKEQSGYEPGTEIRFGVATGWENRPGTRTEYSGNDEGGEGSLVSSSSAYERIDWIPGIDQVRILCDQAGNSLSPSPTGYEHSADYRLTSADVDGQKSLSGLTASAGNGLVWGTGDHRFFALYPAPGMESNYDFTDKTVSADNVSIVSTAGGARISGVIPAEQEAILVDGEYKPNMNYAYMYAATLVQGGSANAVTLSFSPLFTAFEFSLKRVDTDVITAKVARVELSSSTTKLAGAFTADLALSDAGVASCDINTTGTLGDTVGIDLPDGGIALSDTPLKFTFLTLPVDQTNLTLTIYFEGGTKRTLALKDNDVFITVDACKKVYITNVGVPLPAWIYTFDVTFADGTAETTLANDESAFGFQVTSYRTRSQTGEQEIVHWQIADEGYSLDEGETWISADDVRAALVMNTASPLFAQEGDGSLTASDFTGKCYPNPRIPGDPVNDAKASARDLSLYDITGTAHSRETANCYVITRPGWYKFPCVYGNAIQGGATNASAYTGPTGSHVLSQFLRHDGAAIEDPWIDQNGFTPASAELLWTDSRDLVANVSLEVEDGHYYVYFQVDPDVIHEGNAVIALKNSSGTCLWSWHIWAYDNSASQLGTLTTTRYPDIATATQDVEVTLPGSNAAVYPDGNQTYEILKVNLGFCERHAARTIQIKYVQDDTDEARILTITQDGAEMNNPYYQWGRKDPMYPSDGNTGNKPTLRNGAGAAITSQAITSARGATIPYAIQHPEIFVKSMTANNVNKYDWVSNDRYDNLWNAALGQLTYRTAPGATAEDSQVRDWAVTKSVYDPCPPGFKIPSTGVFTYFNTQGPGVYEKSYLNEHNGRYNRNPDTACVNATNASTYAEDHGFYFYTNAIGSGDTSFFPFLGIRGRNDAKVARDETTYWTACPLDNNGHEYAGGVLLRLRFNQDCEPFGYAGRSYGMCIRPMADND